MIKPKINFNFLIITQVEHVNIQKEYFGYSPYVNEMNIWLRYANKVTIVAPLKLFDLNPVQSAYKHENIRFCKVSSFSFTSFKQSFKAIISIPKILITIFLAMQKADHIHLRCPGNMGLLGCLVQIFFPKTPKTAKYAGNWDYNSKQPFTYKLQQKILNNTFLTRNMKVLVYGEWVGISKNIKPFFTATYLENEKVAINSRTLENTIKFVFVGTLVSGKRPLYCLTLIQVLLKKGLNVQLDFYGDGIQRNAIENFIKIHNLQNYVFLHGNQNLEVVKRAYQESHFVLLPSESEGWPKVIAEGMFWGCVPIATAVSCVPYMIDFGCRGLILNLNLDEDSEQISKLFNQPIKYDEMSKRGISWSRKYTLNYFEQEIKLLLQI